MHAAYQLDFLFENREFKITPKSRGADVLFYARGGSLSDRIEAKNEVETLLREKGIAFDSKITSLTSSLESTLVSHNGLNFRFAYKPKRGAGGAGAGADVTALAESAQAIYCAAAQVAKNDDVDMAYIALNVNKIRAYADTKIPIEKMLADLDVTWQASCHYTAQALFSELKGVTYVFHHGSTEVNMIENKFKELNRKLEFKVSNLNKWSPADIYAIRKGFRLDLSGVHSVPELNQYLLNAVRNRDIVPISLKKVSGPPKVKYNNTNPGAAKGLTDDFRYSRGQFAATGKNILGSKDIILYTEKAGVETKIQFRSFSICGGWQGEIKGKTASHGKASHSIVNKILHGMKMPTLPSMKDITKRARSRDPELTNEIFAMASKLGNPGLTFPQYNAQVHARGEDWAFSKWLGLRLLTILASMNQQQLNSFAGQLQSTAKSKSDDSAPFLKVS